jgi:hypothetical protein
VPARGHISSGENADSVCVWMTSKKEEEEYVSVSSSA